jgi:tRNA(fMet)-specific endonuclease VapC
MTGSRIALNTNIAVQLLNGVPAILHRLSSFAELVLPVPVVGELRYGALNSAHRAQNTAKVEQLVSRCAPIGIDLPTAEVYARVRSELRVKGTPIPENDIWIAAICVQHGLPLMTLDQHLTHVNGLRIA